MPPLSLPALPTLPATLLTVGLLIGWSFSASAWAVYKCESAGQVTYSDTACAGGKTLESYDNKGQQGIQPARPVNDKAELQRERAKTDKQTRQQTKAQIKSERDSARAKLLAEKNQRKCALLAQRKKAAEDDLRTIHANVKNQEKARRKSQRANDQYQAACPA